MGKFPGLFSHGMVGNLAGWLERPVMHPHPTPHVGARGGFP